MPPLRAFRPEAMHAILDFLHSKIFPAVIMEKIPVKNSFYIKRFVPFEYSQEISFCSRGIEPYIWMIGNFPVSWLTILISGIMRHDDNQTRALEIKTDE
jgi:hypothetical protein